MLLDKTQDIGQPEISALGAIGLLKKVIKRAIAAVALVIFSLLIFEASVRIIAPQPLSVLNIYERHQRLPLYTLKPNCNAHVCTGETDWHAQTNNQGHRIPQRTGTPASPKATVLVLGGTNTFGYGVDYEQTYAGRIAADHPDLHIINAAVQGYGPVQYRMVLEDLIGQGLTPEMILVGVCPGVDYFHALASKDLQPSDGCLPLGPTTWKSRLQKESHGYRLTSAIYHKLTTGSDPSESSLERGLKIAEDWGRPPLAEARSRVKAEFHKIRQISEEAGAKLLFVLVPTADTARDYRERLATRQENPLPLTEQNTLAILEELGLSSIDALTSIAAMPPGTTHHRFDRHVRSEAHAVIHNLLKETTNQFTRMYSAHRTQ